MLWHKYKLSELLLENAKPIEPNHTDYKPDPKEFPKGVKIGSSDWYRSDLYKQLNGIRRGYTRDPSSLKKIPDVFDDRINTCDENIKDFKSKADWWEGRDDSFAPAAYAEFSGKLSKELDKKKRLVDEKKKAEKLVRRALKDHKDYMAYQKEENRLSKAYRADRKKYKDDLYYWEKEGRERKAEEEKAKKAERERYLREEGKLWVDMKNGDIEPGDIFEQIQGNNKEMWDEWVNNFRYGILEVKTHEFLSRRSETTYRFFQDPNDTNYPSGSSKYIGPYVTDYGDDRMGFKTRDIGPNADVSITDYLYFVPFTTVAKKDMWGKGSVYREAQTKTVMDKAGGQLVRPKKYSGVDGNGKPDHKVVKQYGSEDEIAEDLDLIIVKYVTNQINGKNKLKREDALKGYGYFDSKAIARVMLGEADQRDQRMDQEWIKKLFKGFKYNDHTY